MEGKFSISYFLSAFLRNFQYFKYGLQIHCNKDWNLRMIYPTFSQGEKGEVGPPGKLTAANIQIAFTDENCTASIAGSLRFNSPKHALEFCDGNVWLALMSAGKGHTKLNPGLTCLDILKSGRLQLSRLKTVIVTSDET